METLPAWVAAANMLDGLANRRGRNRGATLLDALADVLAVARLGLATADRVGNQDAVARCAVFEGQVILLRRMIASGRRAAAAAARH
jgi:hypothetical protein